MFYFVHVPMGGGGGEGVGLGCRCQHFKCEWRGNELTGKGIDVNHLT
jgi:hypothetical protein